MLEPHCPSCALPLPRSDVGVCPGCHVPLLGEAGRISTRKAPVVTDDESPAAEPDATLLQHRFARFELSVLEQHLPQTLPERFEAMPLSGDRVAVVTLRVVDRDGKPVPQPLDEAVQQMRTSLEDDADPGLAANLALESLCKRPFDGRLELAVALFEPRQMRVTPYAAGVRNALLWASSEEGRAVAIDGQHDALERKMLREAADHFSNGQPVRLAAGDLVLCASSGFVSRGARVLTDVANATLGEAPLRVVTLAKNALWAELQKQRVRPPPGDIRVVAMSPVLPPEVSTLPLEVQHFRSPRFELALLTRGAVRWLNLGPDHDALLWLEPGATTPVQMVEAAVREGRFDPEPGVRVIELQGESVRAHGFDGPALVLGPRGPRSDASPLALPAGHRLFFAGALRPEPSSEDLIRRWPGGKASRLAEALTAHWKTRKTARALERLALAACSDAPGSALDGLALLTSLGTD